MAPILLLALTLIGLAGLINAADHRLDVDVTGQFMTAIATNGTTIFLSSDFGSTWTATSPPSSGYANTKFSCNGGWRVAQSDASGQVLISVAYADYGWNCPPVFSYDRGQTWKVAQYFNNDQPVWGCIDATVSGDGKVMGAVCVQGSQWSTTEHAYHHYLSTDSGRSFGIMLSTNYDFSNSEGMGFDFNGKNMATTAIQGDDDVHKPDLAGLFVSQDGGQTFKNTPANSIDTIDSHWPSISYDNTGKFVAAIYDTGINTGLSVSADSGTTWTTLNHLKLDQQAYQTGGSVAYSGNGAFAYVAFEGSANQPIYVYDRLKNTLTKTSSPTVGLWGTVATDFSGKYVLASTSTSPTTYVSKDFGATWTVVHY